MTDYYVHPTAIVDDGARIGAGTKLWHFVHVCAGAELGPKCVLGQNVFVAPRVKLGNGVKVQNNVSIYEGVTVEDDAFLGPSCVFTNVINPRSFIERKAEFRPTNVGRGASIGANATIVCGHTVGEYALVGAGSVVTKDVPAYALVVGVPARLIGHVCKCAVRLPKGESVVCPSCGSRYSVRGAICTPA